MKFKSDYTTLLVVTFVLLLGIQVAMALVHLN